MSNTFKTAMLLGVLSALLLLIGQLLGGTQGLVIGFLFAVVTNFASYWFSDKIVLRMYGAKEADPDSRLVRIVTRLSQKAGLPQPRCYIIPTQSPNAFATGRNPEHAAVAATEGILELLDDDELGCRDDCRGNHDGLAVCDVFRCIARRRSTGESVRAPGDDHPCADRRHV